VTLDAVSLSVLTNALVGVADEMLAALVRTAYSSNIKERRDCSTAIFDVDGRCIAQAAAIPVHLGALPDSVAAVRRRPQHPGDVFLLNDPFQGGSHLPDLTVVAPLFDGSTHVGFGASRAHFADVGGMRPGSMPADAREIYQEGLIVPPVRVMAGGHPVDDVLALVLANVRDPARSRGDLRAQIAATALAERRLVELAARHGLDVLLALPDAVLDYTERRALAALARLTPGRSAHAGELEGDGATDDDIPIRVAVEVTADGVHVDFTGTSAAVAGNVNCPSAVTRAACLFAMRALLPADIPQNAGIERVLRVTTEPGSLVDARHPSAVAAGNVETSQRVTDIVRAAMGAFADVTASGQGTMNNVVIGGEGWNYYETLGGGQGASSSGPGDSGVHVGMSNTLNTPIEALELEFPMRVERYDLSGGRGGDGRHRGGDGLCRSIRVLTPATLSLLTDRRRHRTEGANGGGDGDPGENLVNGRPVAPKALVHLAAGDVVTVRTPGGGGWGTPC
jgi:N-methylhydantoinase B